MADESAQLNAQETGHVSNAISSGMSHSMSWKTSSVEPTSRDTSPTLTRSEFGPQRDRLTSARPERSALRTSTMGCADEVPDPAEGTDADRFTTRRRSSIMGIEMTAAAQRRISQSTLLSSDLAGERRPSRLQGRRSSVTGCESLAQFQKQRSGVIMGILDEGSGSDSSEDPGGGGGDAKKQEPSQCIPSRRLSAVHSRNFKRSSTLQNSVEATRLREELQKATRKPQKSVVVSMESEFCGADASSNSGSHAGSRRQSMAGSHTAGSRQSIASHMGSRRQSLAQTPSARFRRPSSFHFMAAITHDCLHEVEVLKKCEAEFVDALIEYTETQFFKEKAEIVKAGDKPYGIYIVAHGTIQALVNDQVVATFGEGHMFCLEAALDVKAVATIRTETFADCRVIPQKSLIHALKIFSASKKQMVESAKKYISELVPHVDLFEITRVQAEGFRRATLHGGHRRRSSLSCGMPDLNLAAMGPLTRQTVGESAFQKTLTAAMGESRKQNEAVVLSPSINKTTQQNPIRRSRSNSVIGFETSVSDSRRVSVMGSVPSMLPGVGPGPLAPAADGQNPERRMSTRRQSVMGCETLGMLGAKMDFGLMALPELPEAHGDGSDSNDSDLLSDPLCSDSENERGAEEGEKEEQEEQARVGDESSKEAEPVVQQLPLYCDQKPAGDEERSASFPVDPAGDHLGPNLSIEPASNEELFSLQPDVLAQEPIVARSDAKDSSTVFMLSGSETPSLLAASLGTLAGAKKGRTVETELLKEPVVPTQDNPTSISAGSELQTASFARPAQDDQLSCAEQIPPTEDPQELADSTDGLQHGLANPAIAAHTVAEPSCSEDGSDSEDWELHSDEFLGQSVLLETDQSASLRTLNPYRLSSYDSLGTFTNQTSDSRLPRLRPGKKLQPLWNKLNVMRAVRWRACRPHRNLRATARITSTGLTTPCHWSQYTSVQPTSRQILPAVSHHGSRPTTSSHLWSRSTTASHPKCNSNRPTHEQWLDMPWWERPDGPLATSRESAPESLSPLRTLLRPTSVPHLAQQGELVELPAATVLPPLNIDNLLRCSLQSGQTPRIGKVVDGETHTSTAKSSSIRGGVCAETEDPFAIGKIVAAVGRVTY